MATRVSDAASPVRGERLDPMRPEPYYVRRRRIETADTFTLALTPVHAGSTLAYAPGQFTMLYAFGVGEVPISISGDPARPDALVQTIRAVGPVTAALGRLKRGDVVGVRGPFGTAWPLAAAEGHDVVLVPGGIGLAPLRPALYHLLAQRERYGRVILLYGARTPGDLLYRREVQRWRAHLDLEVGVTVDRAAADWRGAVGVVTTLIPRAPFDPAHTIALICGPEVMMRFTALELQERGVGPERIFVSLERNMKCALGWCGHCQFGPTFVCKDGPVFRFDRIKDWLGQQEV